MKSVSLASCIGLLAFTSMHAQEFSTFSFDIGAGYTTPVSSAAHYLDEGWNVQMGFGVNFSPYVGAMLNLGYDSFGINTVTLNNAGVSSGGVDIFHATVDPVIHLTPKHVVDLYVTGGGGLFHRYQDFSGLTALPNTGYLPFFGFYPSAFGANQSASYAVNKPGYDVGVGLAVSMFGHAKFFTEAKYDHMFLNNGHTDFIPVTLGFRW